MPFPARQRAGLVALAIPTLVVGGWALFAPASFYVDFPSPGGTWVARLPPFNEHLVTDVGLYLGLGVVLSWAAVTRTPELVRAALVATLVMGIPHLVFHATHLDPFPTGEAVGQMATLAFQVVLPMALLLDGWRAAAAPR